jgi:hypothetical protein
MMIMLIIVILITVIIIIIRRRRRITRRRRRKCRHSSDYKINVANPYIISLMNVLKTQQKEIRKILRPNSSFLYDRWKFTFWIQSSKSSICYLMFVSTHCYFLSNRLLQAENKCYRQYVSTDAATAQAVADEFFLVESCFLLLPLVDESSAISQFCYNNIVYLFLPHLKLFPCLW